MTPEEHPPEETPFLAASYRPISHISHPVFPTFPPPTFPPPTFPRQALLLAPTRHLLNEAVRVTETLTAKTPLEYALICGGSAGERTPSASARLLLATPGRLSELLEKGILTLDGISNVAIASLGAMVDLGFEPHLRRFFEGGANESGSIPPVQARQTLIAVTELPAPLRALAARLTRADVVELTCSDGWRAAACARDRVLQSALFAGSAQSKQATLAELVTAALAADNALVVVLAATRRGCYVLSYYLETEGISTVAVHSSTLKPREREATAERFVSGKARVLVATDAALRTLELSSRGAAIGQLVNFELCASKGEYLERLGYVGGAGHTGRLTTLVGDDDAQHNPKALAELVELLRASANDVPRWLEGLILQQVPP